MNRLITTALFLLFDLSLSFSQNPLWQKVFNTGSWHDDYVTGIALNDSGNEIYITGYFGDSIAFGNNSLVPDNNSNSYLASFSPAGNLNWIHQIHGESNFSLQVKYKNDCVYLFGFDDGWISFDSLHRDSVSGPSVFIAKFRSNGNLDWYRHLKTHSYNYDGNICIDNNNNVYFASVFADTLIQESDTLFSSGGTDIFITRLNSSGQLSWTKKFDGASDEYVPDLAIDKLNNLYVTGNFGDSISIDAFGVHSSAGYETFLTKIHSSGNVQWMKHVTSILAGPSSVTVNDQGMIVEWVMTQSDSIYINNNLASFPVNMPGVILSYDQTGQQNWILLVNSSTNPSVADISHDRFGNFYFNGITFDTLTIDTITRFGEGMFTAKIDSEAKIQWLKLDPRVNGYGFTPNCIELSSEGKIYCGGSFVGNDYLDTLLLVGNNDDDLWFGTLADSTNLINQLVSISKDLHLNIFPNPSEGTFNITSKDSREKFSIEVFDVLGKKVNISSSDIKDEWKQFSLNAPDGIYLLKIFDGVNSASCRLVKSN